MLTPPHQYLHYCIHFNKRRTPNKVYLHRLSWILLLHCRASQSSKWIWGSLVLSDSSGYLCSLGKKFHVHTSRLPYVHIGQHCDRWFPNAMGSHVREHASKLLARCPFSATQLHVASSQGQPFSFAYFKTSKCPLSAAVRHVFSPMYMYTSRHNMYMYTSRHNMYIMSKKCFW
jgi:hypothetical protein